jgi:chaperonin cofactor prefoldin
MARAEPPRATPDLPPHHPSPEQQRAYREALRSLKQLEDDYHAANGTPLTTHGHDVPASPHESTMLERERAVHEAERITLQMTRHWRHLRAKEAVRPGEHLPERPPSPPAAAADAAPVGAAATQLRQTADVRMEMEQPPRQSAAPSAASARGNPYMDSVGRQVAPAGVANVQRQPAAAEHHWRAVLADTEARLGAEIDALTTRNGKLEQEVERLSRSLDVASVDSVNGAVEMVGRAFADAAGPAVDAWKAQVAETEERLSLDIDVLRNTNVELQQQLDTTRRQLQQLQAEYGGAARPDADADADAGAEHAAWDHPTPTYASTGMGSTDSTDPEGRTVVANALIVAGLVAAAYLPMPPAWQAVAQGAEEHLRGADAASDRGPGPEPEPEPEPEPQPEPEPLPFDIEVLRTQNGQLEEELAAATAAASSLHARETAVALRERAVAEREDVVEASAAQVMRELASVRERERRLSFSLREGEGDGNGR